MFEITLGKNAVEELKYIILGTYSIKNGGEIHLEMGRNMEHGAGFSTQIHEMQHMNLDNMTVLGGVLKLLELERINSYNDKLHNKYILQLEMDIWEETVEIQESYANTKEILTVLELCGEQEAQRCYETKSDDYKKYISYLEFILKDKNVSYIDKHYAINAICYYALGVDCTNGELIEYIKYGKISEYLKINSPLSKFKLAIKIYKEGKIEELVKNYEKQDLINLVYEILNDDFIKYINDIKKDMQEFFEKNDINELSKDKFNTLYQEAVEAHIKVFDIEKIKILKEVNLHRQENIGIFIIKNCINLKDKKNYYVIGHQNDNENPIYVSKQIDETNFFNLINKSKEVFILNAEHEENWVKLINKPLFILINDYDEFAHFLENKINTDRDFYIGNIFTNEEKNFFTVLFLVNRKNRNHIWVFPTTQNLANRILEKYHLHSDILYSYDREFLKIFACYENSIDMMKGIQWLFTFLVNSKGEFNVENDMAARFSLNSVRNILNDALAFASMDYKKKFYYPTLYSKAEPFFIIMIFENGKNTGNFVKRKDCLIIFSSKVMAEEWLEKYPYEYGKILGIDKIYWSFIRDNYKKNNVNIFMCLQIGRFGCEDIFKNYTINEINKIMNVL